MLKTTTKLTGFACLIAASIVATPSAYALSIGRSFDEWKTNPVTIGDKLFTYLNSTNLPTDGDDFVEFTLLGDPIDGDYLFDYDFVQFSEIPAFTLEYRVDILDPKASFREVDLDSDVIGFNPPVEDLTTTFTGGTNPVVLQSSNGDSDAKPVQGSPKSLIVFNDYDSNGGAIQAFSNSFHQQKTPEPSALLGFGLVAGLAAFKKNGKKVSAINKA